MNTAIKKILTIILSVFLLGGFCNYGFLQTPNAGMTEHSYSIPSKEQSTEMQSSEREASSQLSVSSSVPSTAPVSKSKSSAAITNSDKTVASKTEYFKIPTGGISDEMRAVWVPYMSLDMSSESDKSDASFKRKYDKVVFTAKKSGMNTLIVHVRPFGDSMYPSDYFPWSHLLTGTQGKNPGYDPLSYMIQATHKAGMKFHAWVNPLRIKKGSNNPPILAENNPFITWNRDSSKSNWTFTYEDGYYYNPGYAQVRKYIADGVQDVVRKYNVDGVQFDDYFYPTQSADIDAVAYRESGTAKSLMTWRTDNINAVVKLVHDEIKSVKPNVVFGISPQGDIQNCTDMAADVKRWCGTSGYVDYICPQIYVNFDSTYLPFEATAKKWRNMTTAKGVKLYLGLPLYLSGSGTNGWQKSNNVIARQIQISRNIKSEGFMLYSWAYLDSIQTKSEMTNVMKLLT